MHAEIRQLIAVRDGEPVDAATAEHVRGCERCRRRVAELRQLKSALRDLPGIVPPSQAWEQIVAQRELETLAPSPSGRPAARAPRFAAAAALAVAIVAGGIVLRDERAISTTGVDAAIAGTAELQRRSRELEYLLEQYRAPGVVSLHTAGAISELEDSIAMIDYQLNATRDERRQRTLWQQRIELMETLVTVRAAENYLDSI
ncbi:MAG TPA: hypothetical protein VF254_06785 [Gammaproteobacteria bacterium]